MERHAPRLDEFSTDQPARPMRIVIAHSDAAYVADLHERLQLRGCVVHVARSGEQARLLAHRTRAEIVVLDSEMPLESGWLTADKLRREHSARVIVVTPEFTFQDRRFGEFVHAAAIVDRLAGPEAVLDKIDDLEYRPAPCNA
jgi:DNA-binding response OmpR family regulator